MRSLSIIGIVGASLLVASTAAADIVTDWNEVAVGVSRRLALNSNKSTRSLAITHLAIYDVVVSVTKTYRPYKAYVSHADPISLDAAVATAAHDALVWLNPTDASELDYQWQRSLDDIPDGPAKDNGIVLGRKVASDLVFSRLSDGSLDNETYAPTIPADPDPLVNPIPGAGIWRPTPRAPSGTTEPAGLPALDPQWRGVLPFGIGSANGFRASAPPALTDAAYAEAYDEVKVVGAFNAVVTDPPTTPATGRSTEQTQIANFWRVNTEIPMNAIAKSVSEDRDLDVEANARLFALLNVALADARIAIWDTKYYYGLWRPITAIRLGERDGNAATSGDAAWRPLLETPAHPGYVSGHSATGAAGAAVLAAIFGDASSFSLGSDTLANVVRSFTSFTAAARENADSRLYGGIHFRFENQKGLELGQALGRYVADHLLAPAPDPGGEGGAGGEGGEGGAGATAGAGGENAPGGEGGAPSGGSAGSSGSSGSSTGGRGGSETGGSGGTSGGAGESGSTTGGSGGSSRGGSGSTDDGDDSCGCSTPGRRASNGFGLALAVGLWLAQRRRRTASR